MQVSIQPCPSRVISQIPVTQGIYVDEAQLEVAIMPVEGRRELRYPIAICLASIAALAIAMACDDRQPAGGSPERVVEVVREVEVPVEVERVVEVVEEVEVPVEVERVVEVVKEVEVPVEVERVVEVVKEVEVPVEVERVVEVVKEVEVPVEVERVVEVVKEVEVPVEVERVVEVVKEVEVPVEVERVVEVVKEVEVPVEAEPAGPPSPGLWAGDLVADSGQTGVSPPWLALRIRHGEDPYRDPWRLEVGPQPGFLPPAFHCDLRRIPDGWELSSCTGLVRVDLHIFAPEGQPGLEVTLSSDSFVARGTLTRIESRDEPQSSDNVEVLWHQPGGFVHTDIWVEDGLVFAPRYDGMIEIIDADSGNVLGHAMAGTYIFDVKARDGILYAATAFSGLHIIDVSDPARPRTIGEFFAPLHEGFTNFHNIFLSPNGQFVYAINQSGYPKTDLLVIDVSDPEDAVEAGRFSLDTDTISAFNFHDTHDVNVMEVEGRLIAFLNYLDAGLWILDVTDPQDIFAVGSTTWEGIFSHSGWPFRIGQRLYYAHNAEGFDAHMTILDVTDLAKPMVVSHFATREGISIHNVQVEDGIAYISYYIDGLRVVDLRDPRSPREIAHFDTVPAENERDILQGAWGVRVLEGIVYISDLELGTYAFRVDVN